MGYTRDFLLSVRDQLPDVPALPQPMVSDLRHFAISSAPQTIRRTRAGKHHQRPIHVVTTDRHDQPAKHTAVNTSNLIDLTCTSSTQATPIHVITTNRASDHAKCEDEPNVHSHRKDNVLVKLGTTENKKPENLKVISINARSVRNKADEIASLIIDEDVDICAITETWLSANSDTKDKVVLGNLIPPGFKLLHVPRSKTRNKASGGGVAVIYREHLKIKKTPVTAFKSFECLEVLLTTGTGCTRLSVVYRPPPGGKSGHPTGVFLDEFHQYIDSHSATNGDLLLVGDFNFHFEDESNVDAKKFKELLFSLNLQQHMKDVTHDKGHVLDLVITRTNDSLLHELEVHPSAISDHFPITFHLPWKRPSAPRKELHLRKYKDIDINVFSEDINNSTLVTAPPLDDVSKLVKLYNETLLDILDKHAPVTVKTVINRAESPWFTEEIKKAKQERRQAERKWRKTKLCIHHQLYKEKHHFVTSLCEAAKKQYYCSQVEDCDGDHAKLFQLTNTLLHKKREVHLPTYACPKDLADKFVTYFSDKVQKIRDEFRNDDPPLDAGYQDPHPPVPLFQQFSPISESALGKIILQGNSKSCRLDPIPTHLLKATLPSLLPTICTIVNQSLSTGMMPDVLKQAAVAPLLKKPSLDVENFKNFRPVSNLPYIGKVIEKVACAQMDTHMTANNMHEPFQSAYRANHSTETALVRVANDVLRSVDRRKCVLLTLLDLSAAFDTVDHDQFLNRLERGFGVTGSARRWLESYFRDRYQSVYIDSTSSTAVPLTTGFPQGSVVGPFGFKPYTKPLTAIAEKHGVSIHLYADDTQLYVSCDPDDPDAALAKLEACIEEIRTWMMHNNLKLNDNKTEFMTIGSRQQQAKVKDLNIKIGNESIPATTSARNIGVVFDATMDMQAQVSQIMRSCYAHIRAISQVRKYLTTDAAEKIVHAFVTSRLDNNNSLLHGIPDYLLNKLQLIQNNCARLIAQKRKSDHITSTLINLHWLPVKSRIEYKVLLLAFKAQNHAAPVYLSDLLQPYLPARSLRSEQQNQLLQPKSRSKHGDRAFSVCAPRLWNDLPVEIKKAGTVDTFKSLLKTHLFKAAYNV